jgi:hypothetical protein
MGISGGMECGWGGNEGSLTHVGSKGKCRDSAFASLETGAFASLEMGPASLEDNEIWESLRSGF